MVVRVGVNSVGIYCFFWYLVWGCLLVVDVIPWCMFLLGVVLGFMLVGLGLLFAICL